MQYFIEIIDWDRTLILFQLVLCSLQRHFNNYLRASKKKMVWLFTNTEQYCGDMK